MGTSKEWSALRVKLGDGMTLLTDSIVVKAAAAEELEPAATGSPEPAATGSPEPAATGSPEPAATGSPEPAATGSPEPEKTAPGNTAEAATSPEYEIVPGNDGFVVLFSSIRAGDVISFSAKVDSEQAEVSAQAQTEDFSVSASHTLGKLPQATVQPVQNAPVQADVQDPTVQTVRWTIVLLCLMCLCLVGVLVYRRCGGARRMKFLNYKWSAVTALFHRKKETQAAALTVCADVEAAKVVECAADEMKQGAEAEEPEIEHGPEQDVKQEKE